MNQKHVDQVSLRIRMGLSIQRESAWEKRVLNPKCLKNNLKQSLESNVLDFSQF